MGQAQLSSLCRISIHKDIVKLLEDANTLHVQAIENLLKNQGDFHLFLNDTINMLTMLSCFFI